MLTQKQKARLILHWLSSSQRRMPRHKVAAVEELGDFHDAFWGQYRPGLIAFTNRRLNNVKCEALHSDLARRLPRSSFCCYIAQKHHSRAVAAAHRPLGISTTTIFSTVL